MTENVVEFPGETCLDLPPDKVLQGAVGNLDHCVVVGAKDGEIWVSSSLGNIAEAVLMLERAKLALLRQLD